MARPNSSTEFDAIVVGSGPAGATIARELTRRNKRVLILERGGDGPLREGSNAFVLNRVSAGDDLDALRAFATGGTTAVYFAVADIPPVEPFRELGIDISGALEEAKRELPLNVMPDHLVGAQALRVRESAMSLGYSWDKSPMLVDLAKCASGYSYDAKWNARTYLREAVAGGATLVTRARVLKVLSQDGKAIGVEYEIRKGKNDVEKHQAFATKTVLSAGGAASPVILRNSGVRNVVSSGFYCHPGFAVFGIAPGLKTGDNFLGSMGTVLDGDLGIGDGNPARMFYRMLMLANKRWFRAFFHSKSIGVGVMVKEGLGGELRENGRYHKVLQNDVLQKLEKGEAIARRIVERAGGRYIFKSRLSAGHIGGTIRIKEHVDEKLETELRDLHVCDGSVIPESVKVSPTLTLVVLGKYLANQLSPAL